MTVDPLWPPDPPRDEPLPHKGPKPPNGDDRNQDGGPHIEVHNAGDIDPTKIPPRGWLLGTTFCRQFISGLNAAGRRQNIDQICSVSRRGDLQANH
jgi:hypothetical protein